MARDTNAEFRGLCANPETTYTQLQDFVTASGITEQGVAGLVTYKNDRQRGKNTVLHLAARVGNVDAIRFLTDKGADVNEPNRYGMTPLMIAAKAGKTGAALELVALGASAECVSRGGKNVYGFCGDNAQLFSAIKGAFEERDGVLINRDEEEKVAQEPTLPSGRKGGRLSLDVAVAQAAATVDQDVSPPRFRRNNAASAGAKGATPTQPDTASAAAQDAPRTPLNAAVSEPTSAKSLDGWEIV